MGGEVIPFLSVTMEEEVGLNATDTVSWDSFEQLEVVCAGATLTKLKGVS